MPRCSYITRNGNGLRCVYNGINDTSRCKKHPMKPPDKMDGLSIEVKSVAEMYFQALRDGVRRVDAARQCGLSNHVLRRARDINEYFEKEEQAAIADSHAKVDRRLLDLTEHNVAAIKEYNKLHKRTETINKHEHTGAKGSPITVEQVFDVTALDEKTQREIVKLLHADRNTIDITPATKELESGVDLEDVEV